MIDLHLVDNLCIIFYISMFYITHLSGLIKNENIQRHIDEIER